MHVSSLAVRWLVVDKRGARFHKVAAISNEGCNVYASRTKGTPMKTARLMVLLWSAVLLTPASAHTFACSKRPRPVVDITSPSDGFFTKDNATFQLQTEIQTVTWRKRPQKSNWWSRFSTLDRKAVAHQSIRNSPGARWKFARWKPRRPETRRVVTTSSIQ